MKLTKTLLIAVGVLSTLAIANHIFASKASASVESCDTHLKSAQGYRKWAKMYQPLAGQNASYRGAFQNYETLATIASADYQRCKSTP
ncbi:MAG: hypothetical protein ABIR96_09015 [Bdellovibrionota bacterium]